MLTHRFMLRAHTMTVPGEQQRQQSALYTVPLNTHTVRTQTPNARIEKELVWTRPKITTSLLHVNSYSSVHKMEKKGIWSTNRHQNKCLCFVKWSWEKLPQKTEWERWRVWQGNKLFLDNRICLCVPVPPDLPASDSPSLKKHAINAGLALILVTLSPLSI